MKTGIFITARLGSTRLKRKHLLPVNSRPIFYYLLKRISEEFNQEIKANTAELVIVTSEEEENKKFEEEFSSLGVKTFYGSKNNIPLRHLQAAKALNIDLIVAVDGDDILCSTNAMRKVFEELHNNGQYISTSGLPFGMNTFGYSTLFLEKSMKTVKADVLETGWGRIFDKSQLVEVKLSLPVDTVKLRFTLDYEDDFKFFKKVIESLGESVFKADDSEIVSNAFKDDTYELNSHLNENYWKNFNANIEKEQS